MTRGPRDGGLVLVILAALTSAAVGAANPHWTSRKISAEAVGRPTIAALPFPSGYGIDVGVPVDLTVGRNGTVGAVLAKPGNGSENTVIVTWTQTGTRKVLPTTKPPEGWSGGDYRLGAIGPRGEIYAKVSSFEEGAGMYFRADDYVFEGARRARLKTACKRATTPSFAAADGSLGMTIDADASGDVSDEQFTGSMASDAEIARGSHCVDLGPSYLVAADGKYVTGYRGYINATSHVPAPSNMNPGQYFYRAVRWTDLSPHELGKGVALAVNEAGTCVGADGYYDPTSIGNDKLVHAMAWYAGGSSKRLLTGDTSSVALGIDEGGRIVGTMTDKTKKRFAFVILPSGKVIRLDSALGDPAWHLEYASGFRADGAIVGTGTHHGTHAVFALNL